MLEVPDLVLIQDAQGRYLYVSPAITRYLDQDRAALIGHTWQELGFPATTMESVDAAWARVLTTGQPSSKSSPSIPLTATVARASSARCAAPRDTPRR